MRESGASSGTPTAPSPSAPTAATSPQERSSWRSRPPTAAPSTSPPPCPPEYEKLAQHWPQGNLSKAYAAYETPFWRANGCSGEALSDEGPVFITFDVSPDDERARHPAGLHRPAHLRFAAARRAPRARAGRVRRPVRRGGAAADRLRRPLLGDRGFRAGRADCGGAAGLVDHLRAVATQARRRHLLGRHGNRRRVDRLPRRRRAVGASRGRRGAQGTVRLGCLAGLLNATRASSLDRRPARTSGVVLRRPSRPASAAAR